MLLHEKSSEKLLVYYSDIQALEILSKTSRAAYIGFHLRLDPVPDRGPNGRRLGWVRTRMLYLEYTLHQRGRSLEQILFTGLPDVLDFHWTSLNAALNVGNNQYMAPKSGQGALLLQS